MTVAADLRSEHGRQLLDRINALDARIASERDPISERLYQEIGRESDPQTRRNLIALRRDLFGGRRPKAGSRAAELLGRLGACWPGLSDHARHLDDRDRAVGEFAETFEADRDLIRGRLSAWVQTPTFQRGLLLGSVSLFEAQASYHSAPPTGALSGRQARTERGLLRYLLRAAMKATPFSTFCIIAPGYIRRDNGAGSVRGGMIGEPSSLRMSVRLNKGLYAPLTRALVKRPTVRDALSIEVNPTLRQVGDTCIFLALNEGREAFQRVPASPVFLLLLALVREHPGIRFRQFIEMIASHPEIECTSEAAEHYAGQMLAAGAIRLCFGIAEQEECWELPLARLLEELADPVARETANSLRALERCLRASERASLPDHARLATETKRLVAAILDLFNDPGVPQFPFREDATADLYQVVSRTEALSDLERTMGRIAAAGLRLSWPRTRQAELRHFFDLHFASGTAVPLLDFYESFYREHFKQYMEMSDRSAREGIKAVEGYNLDNPFGLPIVDRIHATHGRLLALVARRWAETPDADEIELSVEEIESIAGEVPWYSDRATSVSILGTLVDGPAHEHDPRFICRRWQSSVGHGRMFSRWLHTLDPEFLARVRQDNADFAGPVRYAEIVADGGHNANLHPAILPWDISYPNTEGTRGSNTLAPTEIVVEADPGDPYALRLRHVASMATVVPLDLGFVVIDSRPPLYQLLAAFSPPSTFAFPLPDAPAGQATDQNEGSGGTPAPVHRPRIVIGGVVVSRRRWTLPHSSLPKPAVGEPDWRYALRLDRWRESCGLPVVGFMRYMYPAMPEPSPEGHGEGEGEEQPPHPQRVAKGMRAHLNQLKPQYLDFSSPLTANLLHHEAVADRPPQWVFEEQYPRETQVPTIAGQPHATEHVLQVTCHP